MSTVNLIVDNADQSQDTAPEAVSTTRDTNMLYLNVAANAANSSNVISSLEQLETQRRAWEQNELTASHKRLYSLLTECYMYYLSMKTNSDEAVRNALRNQLEQFIEAREYKFIAKTHDMTKIVKSVFGVDRRRVSAYSTALRVALKAHVDHNNEATAVAAEDLASWIEQQGGVDEISKSNTKAKAVSTKPAKAEAAVKNKVSVAFVADNATFDSADNDKQVILIATYRANGVLEVSSVYKNQSALISVLTASDSANQYVSTTKAQTPINNSNCEIDHEDLYQSLHEKIVAAAAKSTIED